MTIKKQFLKAIIGTTILAITSQFACRPIETNPKDSGAGQEEVITKVTIHFTNVADVNEHFKVVYNDADGNGAQLPTIDTLKLKNGTIYDAYIDLYDGINNENLTEEIKKEGEEHCFHYAFTPTNSLSGVNALTSDYDKDEKNMKLGLKFKLQTATTTGLGSFNVKLKHFGEGETKTENPLDGSTDVDINFTTQIK